jgi:hemolysin D
MSTYGNTSQTLQPPAAHPAFSLLARYGAVLRAAWQQRHELAGPKRLADEAAFLPAALSLQETPVHPAPRRAAWALCALFSIALTWSILGQIDIVAVANGRIVVSQGTKLVQPLESAVVKAIHVKNGDRVAAGQLLVELDATAPTADRNRVSQERAAAISESLRSQALLKALSTATAPRIAPSPLKGEGWGEGEVVQANLLLSTEHTDLIAKQTTLQTQAQRKQAELATAREVVAKLEATLPLARQREQDIQALSAQGFIAGHAGQDRQRERIELERDLATAQARTAEMQAAVAEAQQAIAAFKAETQRSLRERLAQAQLKVAQLSEESTKATQRSALTQLNAAVAGTVQQLAVHTAGGVVTPAQVLLVVVPDEAEVTAEVVIDNKDIGFVKAGDDAEVKLETFPFTRYGTVHASVRSVSADAVNDEQRGAIFPATLVLKQDIIAIDGKRIKLSPGMNLTAEIKTGKRRVIDYLLNPVQQSVSESLKER